MKLIEQIIFIGFLCVASWQDFRSKSVAVWVYGLFGSAAWFLNLCRAERTDWTSVGFGIVLCALILLLNRLTEGAIGEGDGYFFLVSGIFLGFRRNMVLFAGGIVFCGMFSMLIMLWGLFSNIQVRKWTVPLLPFLMPVGICLVMI